MALGLGSGTTAELFVRALAPRVAGGMQPALCGDIRQDRAAGERAGHPARRAGGELDLAIDGADAIERESLAVIKGRGGALTREKIVALAARRFVIVGESSKARRAVE